MTRNRMCPGGCGRVLRQSLFACKRCLGTLPPSVQQMIHAAAGKPAATRAGVWADGVQYFAWRRDRR